MPFRYLYLGQHSTVSAAMAAKAAAQQVLYGPTGRNHGTAAADLQQQQQEAEEEDDDKGVPAVADSEVKAMVARLINGRQGELVKSVMQQHGTLSLLDSL